MKFRTQPVSSLLLNEAGNLPPFHFTILPPFQPCHLTTLALFPPFQILTCSPPYPCTCPILPLANSSLSPLPTTIPNLPPHYPRSFPTFPTPHYTPPSTTTFSNLPQHCPPTSPTLRPNYPPTFPTFSANYPPTFPLTTIPPFPTSHYDCHLPCSLPSHFS